MDVTAVVTCFNYGAFVTEAVDSLLGQEGGPPRVVVVDDGSTDPATADALEALPPAVEVVRTPNQGVARARNEGLARAGTPFVLVLDADDRLAPGALAALRVALGEHPAAGFAYGWHRFFGRWAAEVRVPAYDPLKLLDRHLIGVTALMRRELVQATGGFDPAFARLEDWELWLNALAHGLEGVRIPRVVLEYRRHERSKLKGDRRDYREARRQLMAKHAGLYARRRELASRSAMGPAERALYRLYWGPRPVPALVEQGVYELVLRGARRHGRD